MTFSFELSTATQPKVISDEPAIELDVPLGEVTFNVTNPEDNILSHNFKVCSAPLPGPVTTLPGVQKLHDGCHGTQTGLLAPGGPIETLKVDFTEPGAYEYLSTANGPSRGRVRRHEGRAQRHLGGRRSKGLGASPQRSAQRSLVLGPRPDMARLVGLVNTFVGHTRRLDHLI